MDELKVVGTAEALEYIEQIAREMALLFRITMDEAVGRINRSWASQEFSSAGQVGALLHEEPDAWAKTVYYGRDSYWWLGEEGLEPKPYP
jgi:hypothetical protein